MIVANFPRRVEGAIGGCAGLMLKRGGADVSLIARGAHLGAINGNGVKVVFRD